ncbi:MAG: ribose-phosphate pyrophosphokinase [Candidatus Gracilibacteria bacterium]|nr:ribose-phosphate pyrophosphokinase [Candidatus Gracilibacteria bacterium]
MSSYKIFSGSSHRELAESICKELGIELTSANLKRFASNEIYVRLEESVRGKDVFIVQTATKNVNEDYMELFLMADAMKRSFATKVHIVFPFYGYARQDRVAEPRETISAKLMADLLVTSGVDHLMTIMLHSDQIQGFFDIPVDNINPCKLFFDYLKDKDLNDTVIVSPDAGGAKAAKRFADMFGLPLAILNKQRGAHNESEVTHVVGDVSGKTCIIYDDMVDTAGSVCNAKDALIKAGAKDEVCLAVTHAVLSGPAVERLDAAGFKEIIVTDSIPLPDPAPQNVTVLRLAPLIAAIIQRIQAGESVSGLY